MKAVMQELAQARLHYSKLPLFEFMRQESIPARDRIAFYPCMAPFVLSFAGDPQRRWYQDDFARLGFDHTATVAQTLRTFFTDSTRQGRMLAAGLTQLRHRATPVEKCVIVEAIVQAGEVFFELARPIAARILADGGPELRYLGQSPAGRRRTMETTLTQAERVRCLDLAFRVYDMFSDWTTELLAHARNSLAHRTVPHMRAMVRS
jgi:hypothetical protein